MTPGLSAGSSVSLVLLVEFAKETQREKREWGRGGWREGANLLRALAKKNEARRQPQTTRRHPSSLLAPTILGDGKSCLSESFFVLSTLKGHRDCGMRLWVCRKQGAVCPTGLTFTVADTHAHSSPWTATAVRGEGKTAGWQSRLTQPTASSL